MQVGQEDNIDRAVNFLIRCNMGHGFRANSTKVGWKQDVQGRERAYALSAWNKLPMQIMQVVERLKNVQIEQSPAVELIKKFNHHKVLIYADPPYLLNTRYGKQYKFEMSEQDHVDLLEALLQHKGPVIISGYQSDLYDNMLAGWHREYKTSYTQAMTKKIETLWLNFEPQGRLF